MKFFITLLFSTLFQLSAQSFKLSPKTTVSVLTCAPGKDLYATFGHSAIRITDTINNIDLVYNYGTFDFDTPHFYLKFCRGQLLYELSRYPFYLFPYQYYLENRWIKSQTLNLTPTETQRIFEYLEWNALPNNKKYQYDFFKDNCATRINQVLEKNISILPNQKTPFKNTTFNYRNLIHQYLPNNSWAKFGIDLALGSVIDKPIQHKAYLFLPDYNFTYLQFLQKNNHQKLVTNSSFLLSSTQKDNATISIMNPSNVILGFIILSFCLFYFFRKKIWLENIYAILWGITGFLIVFLWFFTDHSATKNNFNIFWLQPLFLFFPFLKKQKWFVVLGILQLFLMYIIGILKIQYFENTFYILSLIPLYLLGKQLITPQINNSINCFYYYFKI